MMILSAERSVPCLHQATYLVSFLRKQLVLILRPGVLLDQTKEFLLLHTRFSVRIHWHIHLPTATVAWIVSQSWRAARFPYFEELAIFFLNVAVDTYGCGTISYPAAGTLRLCVPTPPNEKDFFSLWLLCFDGVSNRYCREDMPSITSTDDYSQSMFYELLWCYESNQKIGFIPHFTFFFTQHTMRFTDVSMQKLLRLYFCFCLAHQSWFPPFFFARAITSGLHRHRCN